MLRLHEPHKDRWEAALQAVIADVTDALSDATAVPTPEEEAELRRELAAARLALSHWRQHRRRVAEIVRQLRGFAAARIGREVAALYDQTDVARALASDDPDLLLAH